MSLNIYKLPTSNFIDFLLFSVFCFIDLCFHLYYLISSAWFMLNLFLFCFVFNVSYWHNLSPTKHWFRYIHKPYMLVRLAFFIQFHSAQNLFWCTFVIRFWTMGLHRNVWFVSKYCNDYPYHEYLTQLNRWIKELV